MPILNSVEPTAPSVKPVATLPPDFPKPERERRWQLFIARGIVRRAIEFVAMEHFRNNPPKIPYKVPAGAILAKFVEERRSPPSSLPDPDRSMAAEAALNPADPTDRRNHLRLTKALVRDAVDELWLRHLKDDLPPSPPPHRGKVVMTRFVPGERVKPMPLPSTD